MKTFISTSLLPARGKEEEKKVSRDKGRMVGKRQKRKEKKITFVYSNPEANQHDFLLFLAAYSHTLKPSTVLAESQQA